MEGFNNLGAANFDSPTRREEVVGDWRLRAACRGMDTELFFPISEMETNKRRERVPTEMAKKAIKVCDSCTVQGPCLEEALQEEKQFGIWGGLTSDQRQALKRRAARAGRRR